VIINYIN